MIYPENYEKVADSAPLTVSKTDRTAMIAKAKELLTKPMEEKELASLLEQHYVASNKHYTSAQLKDVIDQVKKDLTPEPVLEEELTK